MESSKTTAKDFFLWFGAMVALYWSFFAFVALIFDYLNHAMPDALPYYADPYSGSVSYEMAALLVLFPVFLALIRIIRGMIFRDPSRGQIWVRKWALVLTLFVAGLTLVGDLIILLQYFFNGDVTLRFALKVLVVLLVAGGGFLHFLADLRGYYDRNPQKSLLMAWASGILVALTIGAGFIIVGTPWEARDYRFDAQKVNDLSSIQYQVVDYWRLKQKLPASLSELSDPLIGNTIPIDPQSGEAYGYRVSGPLIFELCATFNAQAKSKSMYGRSTPTPVAPYAVEDKGTVDNWDHGVGRTCYIRTIDPERHPPYPAKL